MHLSLSWAGALARTSFWSGTVVDGLSAVAGSGSEDSVGAARRTGQARAVERRDDRLERRRNEQDTAPSPAPRRTSMRDERDPDDGTAWEDRRRGTIEARITSDREDEDGRGEVRQAVVAPRTAPSSTAGSDSRTDDRSAGTSADRRRSRDSRRG